MGESVALVAALLFAVVGLYIVCLIYMEMSPGSESPIPDRKTQFAEYVRGERQLMADWEEAFDPAPRVSFRYFNDDYLELRYGIPKKRKDHQTVAGYAPVLRFSSSQVCWDHARYMMGNMHSNYSDFQRVVSHCERMDA